MSVRAARVVEREFDAHRHVDRRGERERRQELARLLTIALSWLVGIDLPAAAASLNATLVPRARPSSMATGAAIARRSVDPGPTGRRSLTQKSRRRRTNFARKWRRGGAGPRQDAACVGVHSVELDGAAARRKGRARRGHGRLAMT